MAQAAQKYDSIFIEAVARVLADEGGYVNNPSDPGGETNFGISKRELTHVLAFRTAFAILTLLSFLIAIVVYGFVGLIVARSWASGAPLPISEDVRWFLDIGLAARGESGRR